MPGSLRPVNNTPPVGWVRGVIYAADDAERLAEFWRRVLGTTVRMREPGWLELEPGRPNSGALLAFKPRKPGTAPMSIDIEVDDLDAAKTRMEELGASLVEVVHAHPGETHYVMADPEGNRFNLVLPFPPGWPGTTSAS